MSESQRDYEIRKAMEWWYTLPNIKQRNWIDYVLKRNPMMASPGYGIVNIVITAYRVYRDKGY